MPNNLGNSSLSKENKRPVLTPEESALVAMIGVFARMRWIAIAGVIIASQLATRVFHIHFPLLPVNIIVISMVVYNAILSLQARNLKAEASGLVSESKAIPLEGLIASLTRVPKVASPLVNKARFTVNVHVAFDLVALIFLLHYTGGIENPFIFYFILHVIIAAILLRYRVVYILAITAIVLISLLVGLEYAGVVPHVSLEGFAPATLYKQETYIVAVLIALATSFAWSAFMVTRISGEMRKRQREVVELKDSGLREKTKELREATRELTKLENGRKELLRFLGIVTHDLKAPLSAVQSYLQLMAGGFAGEMPEKQKHMLNRSSQRITELLNLISDLLDISRIEGGQVVHEMEEVPLSQVVEDSVENVSSQAKEKKIRLKAEVPKTLPKVRASSARLKQVITNLLVNAIKFTPEKGEIKLRVTERGNEVQVEVLDTGDGITAEEAPHIFDDFYRSSDLEKAGTGLGLSIAKRIVEAHGGKIWVESPNPEDKSARGSKFTFTLRKSSTINTRNRDEGKSAGNRKS